MSIQTMRSAREPAHAAITRPPHVDPQQCDMNTVAGPTNGAISGSCAKRHRPCASVAGLMMSRCTRHDGQSQQL